MTLNFSKKRKENDMCLSDDKAIELILTETVADFLDDIDILRERAEDKDAFDKTLKKLMKGGK